MTSDAKLGLMEKIWVVTPTYNEAENLPVLAEKLFALKVENLKLIIVDDNSPDGTGAVAFELAKKYPISIIRRTEKSGLGTAYVAAFKLALNDAEKPDFIIQMDADLSHDPASIPKLLNKAHAYDLILGSRYISGGRTENWGFFRKLISRFGNWYARKVLGLPYRDLTGGFKCFRRNVLESIKLESLSSVGYNFQIETTYRAHQQGFKICEVPITFTERASGKSKFNPGIMLESFWKVLMLKFKK